METRPKSKRESVSDILLDKLQSGTYEVGAQFASENELMKELGICKGTLREAISTLLDDGLLERRRGIGTFVRSLTSSFPARRRTEQQICLIEGNPPVGRRSLLELASLDALHAAFDPHQYLIRTFHPRENESMEQLTRHLITELHPAAFMLVGFPYTRQVTDLIRKSGSRLVTIGQPEDTEQVPFVDAEHYSGMFRAIDFLLKKGHRKIALFDNSLSHNCSFLQRRDGFLDAFTANGAVPDARLMIDIMAVDSVEQNTLKLFRELTGRNLGFTALVGYGGAFTAIWRELRRMKIAVPEELSVLLYGGGGRNSTPLPMEECAHCCWDVYPMARYAVEMLRDPAKEPPASLFPVEFHEGSSIKSLI